MNAAPQAIRALVTSPFAVMSTSPCVWMLRPNARHRLGVLDGRVVLLGVAFESRHLAATEHRFQRAADLDDARAHGGHLVAIHVHLEFRLVQLEVGVCVHHSRIVGDTAEDLSDRLVRLPLFADLGDEDVQRVIARLK